ncbi:MAG: class I SAM-dependent methyltransferase [Magnetococcales bacterium]|nr:class I SAM-dependent methyltransferase [Magnetococcales bacterium]
MNSKDSTRKARLNAQRQWSENPCGDVPPPSEQYSRQHFEEIESQRYQFQPWMNDIFHFDAFAGKRVLEIGQGIGTDSIQFAKGGAECHAVDITDKHIELARENFRSRGLSLTISKQDGVQLNYPDDSFDAVYSFGVLHHIPDVDDVVKEIHRVLKKDGTLMLGLYYKWSAYHLFQLLIFRGLLKRKLFSIGYDGLLATIETGADGKKIKPYVKLYSESSLRTLLGRFRDHDVAVRHLDVSHFLPVPPFLISAGMVERLADRMGWYVTCVARK